MKNPVSISHVMESRGVKFGTSGARGLVIDMTDEVCYAYTLGFVQYLQQAGIITPGDRAKLPSPATALYGISNECASIMRMLEQWR